LASLRAGGGAGTAEVIGLLERAVRVDPAAVEPRLQLIGAQIRGGEHAAALATAQQGVAARPDSAELLATLGNVQASSGDIRQAIATYQRLAEVQPRSPLPHLRLAELQQAARDPNAARQSYQRALAIAPDLLPAQRGLITLEAAAGRTQQALALARTVQAVPAHAAAGWLYAGEIEAARKNWAPAIAAYRTSLKLEDTVETTLKLHQALIGAKQITEAERLLTDWTSGHPGNPAMLAYRGNLAIGRGDYPAAEGFYAEIVKMQPDNAVAQNNMAVILGKLNKPDALAYAEKANALQPKQPAFMDTLATLLAESGQVDKAIELQKRALELQPGNHALRLNMARLFLRAGQKSHARRELEQLAKLGDRFPQSQVERLKKEL
jgi:putative PEP-CTERM system TPR-repeat lipoprotein